MDFARHTLAPARVREMQEHVVAGCGACREACATWVVAVELARSEAALEPPAAAIHQAMALFRASPPQPSAGWVTGMIRLLFDSQQTPAMAGVRSATPGARKLLFDAAPFLVDLHIESLNGDRRLSIVGQLVRPDDRDEGLRDCPVHLFASRALLASATTNAFGEFQMECERAEHLSLAIGQGDDRLLIPLREMTSTTQA